MVDSIGSENKLKQEGMRTSFRAAFSRIGPTSTPRLKPKGGSVVLTSVQNAILIWAIYLNACLVPLERGNTLRGWQHPFQGRMKLRCMKSNSFKLEQEPGEGCGNGLMFCRKKGQNTQASGWSEDLSSEPQNECISWNRAKSPCYQKYIMNIYYI